MKVLILGAGAVGLCLAARLSPCCRLYAVCRPEHADVIRQHGFRMSGLWGEGRFDFDAGTRVPAGESYDYVLITTKSVNTRQICEAHRDWLRNAETVSLQNGIGNEEIIAEYSDRVIGGTIITGFEQRGSGRVEVTVEGGPIRLGRFPEGTDPAVTRLVELFRGAGLSVEQSDRIRESLWAKTLYNCALNPLGAILDVPYGRLSSPETWSIVESVVREAFAVCTREGVALPWSDAGKYLDFLRRVQLPATAGHHSSMLQDIRRGRQTEIDFINGAVSRLGRKHGVPTPVNDVLVAITGFKTSR